MVRLYKSTDYGLLERQRVSPFAFHLHLLIWLELK